MFESLSLMVVLQTVVILVPQWEEVRSGAFTPPSWLICVSTFSFKSCSSHMEMSCRYDGYIYLCIETRVSILSVLTLVFISCRCIMESKFFSPLITTGRRKWCKFLCQSWDLGLETMVAVLNGLFCPHFAWSQTYVRGPVKLSGPHTQYRFGFRNLWKVTPPLLPVSFMICQGWETLP